MSAISDIANFNPNRGKTAVNVDVSNIKPGDEVTIRGVVARLCPAKDRAVEVRLPYGGFEFFSYQDIDAHTPKPLAVGDKVFGVSTKRDGVVIATHEDLAWVKFGDGRHEVVFPDQVERVS